MVIDGKLLKQDTRKGREWIFWLSDNKVSEVGMKLFSKFGYIDQMQMGKNCSQWKESFLT